MASIDTKIEYWKNRLLDLGKRNRLINCPLPSDAKRVQRHSLLISTPSADDLWVLFEENENTLTFPVPLQYTLDADNENNSNLKIAYNGIKTNQTPNEAHKTLRSLMKKAKEFNEEKGLNALHLAFGFLNWKENGTQGQDMRSPLLLVPVKLTQEDMFSPILLSRIDEEISPNHSLEQKLFSDFGVELPLVKEESSLTDYLDSVSRIVKSLGWSVANDIVQLSLFSFMKINMYRDLERNTDHISAHNIVRALNGEAFNDGVNISDITGFNHDNTEPQEVFSVVDADSSQQDAILLAKRGTSFVLQGPPGTGKSQTISNIIAELVANGKKVLFVSEKMAALEVVYKRLSQVGLGDFCLTLHSHKAKRREILDQLEKSMKLSRQRANLQQDAFKKLYRLKETRYALNQYNKELHTVIEPLGKTIFQVYGLLAQLENYHNIDYVQMNADTFTSELLSQCETALEEVTRIVTESGYQQNNPWNGCVLTKQPTFEFKQRFTVDSDTLLQQINVGLSVFSETNAILAANADWGFSDVKSVKNVFDTAKRSPKVEPSWVSLDLKQVIETVHKCIAAVNLQNGLILLKNKLADAENDYESQAQKYNMALQQWKSVHDELISTYDEAVLSVDARTMLGLYRNDYRSWIRGFISGYRQSQKMLRSYYKTDDKFSYADGLFLLDKIITVQTLKDVSDKQFNEMQNVEKHLTDCKNRYITCENEFANFCLERLCEELSGILSIEIYASTDFTDLRSKLLWCAEMHEIQNRYSLGNDFVNAACVSDKAVFDKADKNVRKLSDWEDAITPMLDKFTNLFAEERKQAVHFMPLKNLSIFVNTLRDNFASLEYLVDYHLAEAKLRQLGIHTYLEKAKEMSLNAKEIVEVFNKCFFRSWLDMTVPKFPSVNEFRRLRQDDLIELFKDLDKTHLEISKASLIAKLISRLPNFDTFTQNGELALLRREMAKQRKLMPIRKLIAALPNLLPVLKPCVMMSPLSVSTYLGDSNYEFDTVIFDEASQIRTEDSIGAIIRARQAIIAGDSKQLPPTDFFSSSISGSDDYEEDEDGEANDIGAYESLLDEATLLPTQTLLWHYRSRHENLITFSNRKIYGGNLVTFPSSVENAEGMGVEYVFVSGGTYDRGGKNGNKAEAAKVADLVFEHFMKYPNRSLGIIAFGEAQQSAIQDALIEKRRANPTFEPYFKEDAEEALFIKNLETVQGDERDTIIFSIGYAPDQTGKFILNFGPLSRNGGERRLNVAVTRARYNLKLVGSIMPTDIAVDRTSCEGPKLLRLYIDFAINGANAILGETMVNESTLFDSPFEASVYDFLAANGFDVVTQVGCSGYRIDMAVRHPKHNGRFAIGIECDGAMYHSARTARERDRLRQTVLEDMGWVFYRVWSTDWIKNQQTEGRRLLEAVKQAIEEYHEVTPNNNNNSTKMTDFLNVDTVSVDESITEGNKKKFNAIRSRNYFCCGVDQIPCTDIDATMLKVLANNFGLDKVGLFKETAFFGYGWERQGSKIKIAFEGAYRRLLRNEIITEESDGKLRIL